MSSNRLTPEQAKTVALELIPFAEISRLSQIANLSEKLDILYPFAVAIMQKKIPAIALETTKATDTEEKKGTGPKKIDIRELESVTQYNQIAKHLGLNQLEHQILASDAKEIEMQIDSVLTTFRKKLEVGATHQLSEDGKQEVHDLLAKELKSFQRKSTDASKAPGAEETKEETTDLDLSAQFTSILQICGLNPQLKVNEKTREGIQAIVATVGSLTHSMTEGTATEASIRETILETVKHQLEALEYELEFNDFLEKFDIKPIKITVEDHLTLQQLRAKCNVIIADNQDVTINPKAQEQAQEYFKSQHKNIIGDIAATETTSESLAAMTSEKSQTEIDFIGMLVKCDFNPASVVKPIRAEFKNHYLALAEIMVNKFKHTIESSDEERQEFKRLINELFIPLFISQQLLIVPLSKTIAKAEHSEEQLENLRTYSKNRTDTLVKTILLNFVTLSSSATSCAQLVESYEKDTLASIHEQTTSTFAETVANLKDQITQDYARANANNAKLEAKRESDIARMTEELSNVVYTETETETAQSIETKNSNIEHKFSEIQNKIEKIRALLALHADLDQGELKTIEKSLESAERQRKKLYAQKGRADDANTVITELRHKETNLREEFTIAQTKLAALRTSEAKAIKSVESAAQRGIAACDTAAEKTLSGAITQLAENGERKDRETPANVAAKKAKMEIDILASEEKSRIINDCSHLQTTAREIFADCPTFSAMSAQYETAIEEFTSTTKQLYLTHAEMHELEGRLSIINDSIDELAERINTQIVANKTTAPKDSDSAQQPDEEKEKQARDFSGESLADLDHSIPQDYRFKNTSAAATVFTNLKDELAELGDDFGIPTPGGQTPTPTTPMTPVAPQPTTPTLPTPPATVVSVPVVTKPIEDADKEIKEREKEKDKKDVEVKEQTPKVKPVEPARPRTLVVTRDIYNDDLKSATTHELATIAKLLANDLENIKNTAMIKASTQLEHELIADARKMKEPAKPAAPAAASASTGLFGSWFGSKPPKPEIKQLDESKIVAFLMNVSLLANEPVKRINELQNILNYIRSINPQFKMKITTRGLVNENVQLESLLSVPPVKAKAKEEADRLGNLSPEVKQRIIDSAVTNLIQFISSPAEKFKILSYFLTTCCSSEYIRSDETNADVKFRELIGKLRVNRIRMRAFIEKGLDMYVEPEKQSAAAPKATELKADASEPPKDVLNRFNKPVLQNYCDTIDTYIEFFEGLYNVSEVDDIESKRSSRPKEAYFSVFTKQLYEIRKSIHENKDKPDIEKPDHNGDLIQLIGDLSENVKNLGIALVRTRKVVVTKNKDTGAFESKEGDYDGGIQMVYRAPIEKIRMVALNAAKSYLRDFDEIVRAEKLSTSVANERKATVRTFIKDLLKLALTDESGKVNEDNKMIFFKLIAKWTKTIDQWAAAAATITPTASAASITASAKHKKFDPKALETKINAVGKQVARTQVVTDQVNAALAAQTQPKPAPGSFASSSAQKALREIAQPVAREMKVVQVTDEDQETKATPAAGKTPAATSASAAGLYSDSGASAARSGSKEKDKDKDKDKESAVRFHSNTKSQNRGKA